MNTHRNKLVVALVLTLPAMAALTAGSGYAGSRQDYVLPPADSTGDNTPRHIVYPEQDPRPVYPFFALARAYDDNKIVLRWATTQYVPWRVAGEYGYDIIRRDLTEGGTDTVATGIRPMTLEQMMERFSKEDMLAGVAAQLLYGKGAESINRPNAGGSALMDVYDEQQSRYADALMLAEWRADLAEAMAMSAVDDNVKPGHVYEYHIMPNVPDSVLRIMPAMIEVENVPYVRPPYLPAMSDSVLAEGKVIDIQWDKSSEYSAYDIERRREGQTDWTRLNRNPFITMTIDGDPSLPYEVYTDPDVELGTYYYRVRGYDSFGQKGPFSPEYKVVVRDLEAPRPPQMRNIELHRNDDDPENIRADFHWVKDTIEADLVGYNIYYYHPTRGTEWVKLNEDIIAPDVWEFTADVSGFPSGHVIIGAVDASGNQSGSMPVPIDIADLTPPTPPTGMKSMILPDGTVILKWDKNPERDVAGYQLYYANDTTHMFMAKGPVLNDTITTDSTAVTHVNQKYIYYRLRAVDYAGNQSEMSPIHAVQRVNYSAPEACVPDSVWQNDSTLYIDWRTFSSQNTKEYRLYRKLEGALEWAVVQIIPSDDASEHLVHTSDSPDYNRTRRYLYALETVNSMGLTAGRDHVVSLWHRGPSVIDLHIDLTCEIDRRGRVVLRWEPTGDVPLGYYYSVEMMREGEDMYSEYRSYGDHIQNAYCDLLHEGQRAKFRVRLRWADGLVSTPSNEIDVTLKIPHDEQTNQ